MSQESAGASRRVVSGEESVGCGEKGGAATVQENRGAAGECSNVANGPTPVELLALVDATIVALDAGETEVAKARLQTLAEALRSQVTAAGEMACEERIG